MKIYRLFFSIIFTLIFSLNVYAIDYIAGAKGGYYEWDPWIKDIDIDILENIDKGSGVLYGPVFSLMYNQNISMTLAALLGTQKVHWYSEEYNYEYNLDLSLSTSSSGYAEYKRLDIDAALNYSFSQLFKIFAGYKYQSMDITIKSMIRRSENDADSIEYLELGEYELETPAHGPALGFGGAYGFGNDYFIAANISGLYMRGKFKIKKIDTIQYDATTGNLNDATPVYKERATLDTEQIGLNIEPTIGKSIDDGQLILTLGLRYQLLRTRFSEKHPIIRSEETRMNDQLYGIFVSILYLF